MARTYSHLFVAFARESAIEKRLDLSLPTVTNNVLALSGLGKDDERKSPIPDHVDRLSIEALHRYLA